MKRQIRLIKMMLGLVVFIMILQALTFILKHGISKITTAKWVDLTAATLNKYTMWLLIFMCLVWVLVFGFQLIDGGILKNRNLVQSYKNYKFKNLIDKSLIYSEMYKTVTTIDENKITIAKTPKVNIIDDVTIHVENMVGLSDKLDNFKSHLSATLKGTVIVDTFQLDKSANFYEVKFINMSQENRYLFETNDEYLESINSTEVYELPLMKNLVVNVAKTPHMLVAGATGQGKSYLLYHILFNFILKDCDIYLIDRKKVLTKFKNIVGHDNVADDHPEEEDSNIFKVIKKVEQIMDERERILNEKYAEDLDVDFRVENWKPVFLAIDELGSLASEFATPKNEKAFYKILQSIIQRGRATGVNVIISLQQPNAKNLPTAIRDNLMFKTILGDTDETTRSLVFTSSDLSDIKFQPGEGYFTLAGKHNKPSVLFVPTFKIPLTIENLKELKDVGN
ncbi:FtsK/SpoIIIE domain-containing protein [Staphylococcus aureus]|uniref:FtsK/SpoIIIE domain-containing protein n=1 Tax=Staphylococcus aureus TaxID=1280 RepID=UPI00156EB87D|nr:FtsK/SpoIIIE domain-containing protein [Staphylococcus aureus]